LGQPCSGWRNGQFYNLCKFVLAALSTCAHRPWCVARVGPETIGPLYHPTGSRSSQLAGLMMSDDLDSTGLPDTPFQGAVVEAAETRLLLTATRRPAARFVRHLQRAERLPGNMWGCASVIGLSLTPSASLSGVVGCVVASRASHCLQTVCDAQRVVIGIRSILLLGCCNCNLRESSTMSQRRRKESEESSSSSDYNWDGLPSPDVLRKYREPKWYTE